MRPTNDKKKFLQVNVGWKHIDETIFFFEEELKKKENNHVRPNSILILESRDVELVLKDEWEFSFLGLL